MSFIPKSGGTINITNGSLAIEGWGNPNAILNSNDPTVNPLSYSYNAKTGVATFSGRVDGSSSTNLQETGGATPPFYLPTLPSNSFVVSGDPNSTPTVNQIPYGFVNGRFSGVGGSGIWNYHITGFIPQAPYPCSLDFSQGITGSIFTPAGGSYVPIQEFLCPYDLDTSQPVLVDMTWACLSINVSEAFFRLGAISYTGAAFPTTTGVCEYTIGSLNSPTPIAYNTAPNTTTRTFTLNPADVSRLVPGKDMFYTSVYISFQAFSIANPAIKLTLRYTSKTPAGQV